MSTVISNLDRSYSIVLVENFIAPEYIPLSKVYNRIESILKRDYQKLAKENGLKKLRKKYNVVINTGFILNKKILSLILLMQCAIMQDAVDGIVAVVEDKIILKSDVILNMQLSGVPLSQNSYTLSGCIMIF